MAPIYKAFSQVFISLLESWLQVLSLLNWNVISAPPLCFASVSKGLVQLGKGTGTSGLASGLSEVTLARTGIPVGHYLPSGYYFRV